MKMSYVQCEPGKLEVEVEEEHDIESKLTTLKV